MNVANPPSWCPYVRRRGQSHSGTGMRIYSPVGEGNRCPAGGRETTASFGANPLRIGCGNVQRAFSYECETTYIEPTEV